MCVHVHVCARDCLFPTLLYSLRRETAGGLLETSWDLQNKKKKPFILSQPKKKKKKIFLTTFYNVIFFKTLPVQWGLHGLSSQINPSNRFPGRSWFQPVGITGAQRSCWEGDSSKDSSNSPLWFLHYQDVEDGFEHQVLDLLKGQHVGKHVWEVTH